MARSITVILFLAATGGPVTTPFSAADQPPSTARPQPLALCEDSEGDVYSEGAVVQINGQLMRCVIGPHWAPLDSRPSAASRSVLDVTGVDVSAPQRDAILQALAGRPLPELHCDAVLNSNKDANDLLHVPANHRLLMMFWTPTCAPCKPLLGELATFAGRRHYSLAVLGVVQAADPELDPPGDWRLLRVQGLMSQYSVDFPTCVHSSSEVSEAWQATGVPLTIVLSDRGVERVALGGKEGHDLLEDLFDTQEVGRR